ncbi:MAG TPA: DegT/DnrJ/EryC1/StrS family aminotransferase [Chloroflexota bacterium]|nr:DegT/DnrJ/EryC1/StrS family aminotransferase [Chloroflexota bacterium]
MTIDVAGKALAINGGPKTRTRPMPRRALFGEEEKAAAVALFDEAIHTGNAFGYDGAEEVAYCEAFAASLGGGYADAVNSGSSAVYVALRALDLEPFTEVICPAMTDPGGIMPVPLLNCIPIVADARPGSYNVGPREVQACLSERTSAIVVAHIAGEPVDLDPILELARGQGIPVVEDCAQAHGARYKGKPVGTLGQVAAFSTMSGKHHATGAQGGVVFTRDESIYWRARRVSDRGKPYGLTPGTGALASSAAGGAGNVVASLNLNSNDLAAAIGLVQLRKLDAITAGRRRVAEAIADGLRRRSQAVSPGWVPAGAEPSYWFMRLHVDSSRLTVDGTTFARALGAEGIPLSPTYGGAMQAHAPWLLERRVFGTSHYPWSAPEYRARGGDPTLSFPCPNAVAVLESDFNLSIHERWDDEAIADTLEAIEKVERAYAK